MNLVVEDNDETNETLLLHEAARHLRVCFDRRAQHLGLTRAQWQIMAVLRRNPGINQTHLADRLEVEPITMTRHLDRMSLAGWIERRPDPRDRRANLLYLSDKTQSIIKEMRQISVGLRRDALKGFSTQEHNELLIYLKRMKQNINNMLSNQSNHA